MALGPQARPPRISLRQGFAKDQLGTVVRLDFRWYVPAAVSGGTLMKRSARARCALLIALSALALGACTAGGRLDENEPLASFTVSVPVHTFPASQTLSTHSHLVLVIRNDSNKVIPNVAVTLCNVTCKFPAPAGEGPYAQPFGSGPPAASPGAAAPSNENATYQVWVVDKPPGICTGRAGYSCAGGSYGSAVTYDANTWAQGPLKPGASSKFDWAVTAVKPGRWTVAWEVSAGLSGKARAVLSDGTLPQGTFPVTISNTPAQSYVNSSGQIVSSPTGR